MEADLAEVAYKFGVLYVREGQVREEEMFGNSTYWSREEGIWEEYGRILVILEIWEGKGRVIDYMGLYIGHISVIW